MSIRLFLVALFTLLATPTLIMAQPKNARELQFESDKASYNAEKELMRLTGNVIFKTPETVLTADFAEFFQKEKRAEVYGNLRLVNGSKTLTAKKLTIRYPQTRAFLEGGVKIVDSDPQLEGGAATLTASTLDYNWSTEIGEADGGVKVRQAGQQAFGNRAIFKGQQEMVELIGDVRIERAAGDWLTASRADYDLRRQTITASGRVVAKTSLAPLENDKNQDSPTKIAIPAPGPFRSVRF